MTGFLLIVIVLCSAIFFMYRALSGVSTAVGLVGEPSRKLVEWKSTANLINEAEINVRAWRITGDKNALMRFDSCRMSTTLGIIRLRTLINGKPEQLALSDSLASLAAARFDLLGTWITLSDSMTAGPSVVDDILNEMALQEQRQNKEREAAAVSESKTESDRETGVAEPLPNFWQSLKTRIRGPRPDDVDSAAISKSDTAQAKPVVIETEQLRRTIRTGQQREETEAEIRLREETELLRADQQIMSRLYVITGRFEKIIAQETAERVSAAAQASAKSTRNITIWMIAASLGIILFSVYFIAQDVKREKKLKTQLEAARENAERLARAKEDFLANMSHEIRTPLNVISGFSAQILKSPLSEHQRLQAEGIHRSSEHLLTVVNDLLDFSKIKSGKLVLENITFSLSDIIRDLQAAFGATATARGIHFGIDPDGDVPDYFTGDPVRVRQILFNLVSNAIKFTEKGSIITRFSYGNDGKLTISVSDTGIGIPPEKIGSIFEEFTQADTTITRKYGGSGLGLSITRHLVEEMKGEIKAESAPGKGSTFTVILPLEKADKKPSSPSRAESPAGKLLKDKTILVCDDEPFNRMLAAHLLQSYGAKVTEADSGQATLSLLEKQNFDAIMMDLQMPGMSGHDTIREIRRSPRKEVASVKIIAVTGHTDPSEQENGGQKNTDGYLQKPYKENQLIAELGRLLS